MSAESASDDKAVNTCAGIGCSLFFVIAVIGVSVALIVDCASEDKPPPPTLTAEELATAIIESEWTDENIRTQDEIIEKCLLGEFEKGIISEEEATAIFITTRDKTDPVQWKRLRILLTLECINKGYGNLSMIK